LNTLIFQITLKQWDKSQRSDQHIADRQALATEHSILGKAEFIVLGMPCIMDQRAIHLIESDTVITGNAAGIKIDKFLLTDGSIKIDRFTLFKDEDNPQTLHIQYTGENNQIRSIGSLDTLQSDSWCKASYQWRYRLESNSHIFWQYEQLTIHMACLDTIDPEHFINHSPSILFVAPED
jgi:hypothetical protein